MRKITHNFNQHLCSKMFSTRFLKQLTLLYFLLGEWVNHLGDVLFLTDKVISDLQIVRIYNLVSNYIFTNKT